MGACNSSICGPVFNLRKFSPIVDSHTFGMHEPNAMLAAAAFSSGLGLHQPYVAQSLLRLKNSGPDQMGL